MDTIGTRNTLANFVYEHCQNLGFGFDYFLGIPQGAAPLGERLNGLLGNPNVTAAVLRAGSKVHGKPENRYSIGTLPPGRIILIEDVSTTGGSSMDYILKLQEIGRRVVALVPCVSRYERCEGGRTVEDVIKRDYHVPVFAPLTTAKTLLPKAVLKFNPPKKLLDDIEAYYRQYGVEPITLPRAA